MSVAALRLARDEAMMVTDGLYLGAITSKALLLPHLSAVLVTRGSALGGLWAFSALLGGNPEGFARPIVDFGSLVEAFPVVFAAAVEHVVSCGGDGKLELTLVGHDGERGRAVSFDAQTGCYDGADLPPGVWGSPALADREWPQPLEADLVALAQDQVRHMRSQGYVESTGGPFLETRITPGGVATRVLA